MFILLDDGSKYDHPVMDFIISMYFVAIGAYGPSTFTSQTYYNDYVMALYIIATFVSSVIFFNMMINVMGMT